jgi:pSer/pThr/pTyr-binding forkhead associated (FHA) protein
VKVSLVTVSADGKTKELPAMSLPITFGRGEECKVRIPLAAVSRKHCELVEDDDELVVRDLKSSNGTYVNRERVKQRELIPGDLISVGGVLFVVRIDGHPKVIDPIISWANGAVGAGAGPGEQPMMDGVPTWSGKPEGAPSTTAPAPSKPVPKMNPLPSKKQEEEDLNDILKDLSESDFDIDFGEDEPKIGPTKK